MIWKPTSKKLVTLVDSWRMAQDWSAWWSHVGGLCSRRGDEDFDFLHLVNANLAIGQSQWQIPRLTSRKDRALTNVFGRVNS